MFVLAMDSGANTCRWRCGAAISDQEQEMIGLLRFFFVCFSEPLNWQAEDVRLTNSRFFLQKPGKMDIIRRKWERGFKETEAKVACISAVT